MSEHQHPWEKPLQDLAASFTYPPTPDLSADLPYPQHPAVRITALVRAAIVLMLVILALLAVPQVRAKLLEVLKIGSIQILIRESTPTAAASSNTMTPFPPDNYLIPGRHDLSELSGETTFDAAQNDTSFEIKIPAALGRPDRVFVPEETQGSMVVLIWSSTYAAEQASISLHILDTQMSGIKSATEPVELPAIGNTGAVWVTGEHYLFFENLAFTDIWYTTGNVLIWEVDGITYRLESDLSLEEATSIAESLSIPQKE